MELAIELAQRRRDASAQRLAQVQRAQAHAVGQLQQLQDYAGETQGRIVNHAGASVSMEVLRHHYLFQGRLHDAIRLQSEAVQGMEERVRTARADLAKSESAVMGLKKVLQQRQAQIRHAAQRREQGVMDELATQLHIRRAQAHLQGAQ